MSYVSLNQSERLLVGVLGFENVASPYIEDLLLKEEIAAQFLENICIHEHKRVGAWLSRKYGPRSKEVMYWLQFGDMPLDIKQKNGNGFLIQCIVEKENVSIEEAMRIIICGCVFSSLARFIDVNPSGRSVHSGALHQDARHVVAPSCLVIKGEKYFYTGVIYKRNFSKKIDSGFARYCHENGRYILLPLVAYPEFDRDIPIHYLSLGVSNSLFSLLNADILNLKRYSNVLFFVNLNISNDFSLRIKDSSPISSDECIATSHYGGADAIKYVDFSCVRSHNVYIFPHPSNQGYLDVMEYAAKCVDAGANSVYVVLDPVLEFDKPLVDIEDVSISCPFQRYVANNAFCYKDKELSPMIYRFLKHAILYEKFNSWAQEHMLVNNECSSSTDQFSFQVSNGSEMVRKPLGFRDDRFVSLDTFIRPDKLSMIAGFTHEGKTIFIMSLILASVSGINMFMFKNNKKRNVLLVDSESGEEYIQEILIQLSSAYGVDDHYLGSFNYISLLNMPHGSVHNFDLLSESTQDELKTYVQKNSIGLIVLDNLQSMFENASSSSKTFYLLIKFAELMQSIDVSVLFVHHTLESKKDKPQGLTQLVNRIRNWILLEGPSTLGPELEKLGEDADPFVAEYIKHPGVLMRIKFKKCTSYPHLRGRQFLYHLPYVNIRTDKPKKWICDNDFYARNDVDDFENIDDSTGSESLSNFRIVTDTANDFKSNCDLVERYASDNPDFNGKQIEDKFELSKKEVKKILDHLVATESLDRVGCTSNTKYRIRFQESKN